VSQLEIERDGVRLLGEQAGEGIPVVLLHGLTATRRYVVMGSRALERSGHSVIAFDARGHGESGPAASRGEYDYVNLTADLTAALDELEIERAVLAGASMGAHTALRFALDHPDRTGALAVITPAHDPAAVDDPQWVARWDRLAQALRSDGVEGFVAVYAEREIPERWRETALKVVRQRLAQHRHPDAVADAMQAVPRSQPFSSFAELAAIEAPAVVVASRDEADPGHPYAVAEATADALGQARLVSEAAGESPLAWQGGQLSKLIAEAASVAAREGRLG
jgi:pimeloyl-ACP methyl ester carboxylesterase